MSWMPPSYQKDETTYNYQNGGKRIYVKNLKYDSSLPNVDIINNISKSDSTKS
jgi:hypothetical protein